MLSRQNVKIRLDNLIRWLQNGKDCERMEGKSEISQTNQRFEISMNEIINTNEGYTSKTEKISTITRSQDYKPQEISAGRHKPCNTKELMANGQLYVIMQPAKNLRRCRNVRNIAIIFSGDYPTSWTTGKFPLRASSTSFAMMLKDAIAPGTFPDFELRTWRRSDPSCCWM